MVGMYKHSGELEVPRAVVESRPAFLEYIRGGVELNLCVAIDYTASNGSPSTSSSLHYRDPTGAANTYEEAMLATGSILQVVRVAYSTILHCIVLYCIVLYCTILNSTVTMGNGNVLLRVSSQLWYFLATFRHFSAPLCSVLRMTIRIVCYQRRCLVAGWLENL